MRIEHLTFAVAKRLEHELFYKTDRPVELEDALKGIIRPTPGQSVNIMQKEAKEQAAAYAYQLAEAVVTTISEIYERSDYH